MDIKELITHSFGADAAEAWSSFSPSAQQVQLLADAGRKVLEIYPSRPGACALMSALYALHLEKLEGPPAYVVAGSLFIGTTRIFGEDSELDGAARFSQSDLSWDGHAWIVSGNRLADVSIFRTAYSPFSPPALATHVLQEFGKNRGLMICKIEDAIKSGLRYEPRYVLTRAQVDGLGAGAIATIDAAKKEAGR